MSLGKIKDAWPVWALIVIGVVIIIFALNQSKIEKEALTIEDIFTDKDFVPQNNTVADPVQSPAIVTNSDSRKTLSYAVQLYSFQEKNRADSIVTTLKNQELPVYVQMSDLGEKGTWYRVRVGPYSTIEEATAKLASLSKEHKGSILVKEKEKTK